MAPIQVSLTDQEYTALEKLAAEQHVSVPELAHKMVVSGLQKPASRWTPERKRRALAAVPEKPAYGYATPAAAASDGFLTDRVSREPYWDSTDAGS